MIDKRNWEMQHFLRVFPNFLNVSNAQPWHGMPLRKLLSDKKIKELRKGYYARKRKSRTKAN